VDDEQKNLLLGGAAALLMPIEWDEPFGIVMIEAMACGTPVIAFTRGSVPEIVRDGVNGFACRNESEAVQAVSRVGTIDRAGVRHDAVTRFSADVIVEEYEHLYLRALERTGKGGV
jgi:glycosyltransferase involved in cell wall biosynthesis